MQAFWWWWGLAVLLGLFEMLTATFFLLVLGIGCAAGGLVAWSGGGPAAQLLAAALVSFMGWLLLRRVSHRRAKRDPVQSNRDVLLDIGERVRVDEWQPGGHARVVYRGAEWSVQLEGAAAAAPASGEYRIRRIEGSRLIVSPCDPSIPPADSVVH